MGSFPPQDLECPDPDSCPVIAPEDLPELTFAYVPEGAEWYRAYDSTWGYDEPNPGFGDTRFGPFDANDGHRVPTMYLAQSPEAALLETVFHDFDDDNDQVYWRDVMHQMLVPVANPQPLILADLTDEVLDSAGIDRGQVSSTPSEHYPCTRRLARAIYDTQVDGTHPMGIIWHSRQAEVRGLGSVMTMVIFTDRYAVGRGGWRLRWPGVQGLTPAEGYRQITEIATRIGATILKFSSTYE